MSDTRIPLAVPLFLFLTSTWAAAQVPLIPSTPVEATLVPVFTNYRPAAGSAVLAATDEVANFRLHLEYRLPDAQAALGVRVHPAQVVQAPADKRGVWRTLDVQYEQLPADPASVSAWVDGVALLEGVEVPSSRADGGFQATAKQARETLRFDGDFTVLVRFAAQGDGALFSKCRTEQWQPNAKLLGLRNGRLFYDIGWLGVLTGRDRVADGKSHVAVLRVKGGTAQFFLDGKAGATRQKHTAPDDDGHTFQLERGSKGFVGDLHDGSVGAFSYWPLALTDEEAARLSGGQRMADKAPAVAWTRGGATAAAKATFKDGIEGIPARIALETSGLVEIRNAWVQPLGDTDHAALLRKWGADSLARGEQIYKTLCITCHGTETQEGSLPTSRKFHREPMKNGADPFRLFQTATKGYGQMIPLPQFSPEDRYAAIHYIRETFLRTKNPTQFTAVDDAYLAVLPRAMRTLNPAPLPAIAADTRPQYEKMDFGPALLWTYQIDAGTPAATANFAYKGIAVRLDPGTGGVTRGRAWMVYDHDTMRVAAATRGKFINWVGIAFDGSHNSHTSLAGEPLFMNPAGPGWADPATGSWDDPRLRGRDGKPYGPLPREWAHYEGLYVSGDQCVVSYTVGGTPVLDAPGFIEYGAYSVFARTLNIGKANRELKLRIAPVQPGLMVRVIGAPAATIVPEAGFHVLRVAPHADPVRLRVLMAAVSDESTLLSLGQADRTPLDLSTLTKGGAPRWTQAVTTQGQSGDDDGPFATDVLTHPDTDANPWQSWMRLTGFDFFKDGHRAAVCTWMGDVWIVEGIAANPLGELKWRRICTGLFQPLGLKIVDDTIFVCCRDQIARLRDLNGDGEIDFVQNFNNDHQVTEHFHEFAMGLQTDPQTNFYYAKSARHGLPALVPQHGTALRVSADGAKTEILASGFRAANGICVNPDGTLFLTDQEGFWMPKNRINLVRGLGPAEFHGNMWGYSSVTNESDDAMEQPLVWITNDFDRSPSEEVWVPSWAKWGALNGQLLNLSYGYGTVYTVPFERIGEKVQGAICALPMPKFPTGVMRGRFHPGDGQFYGCGMYAWAGNQTQPGGFYRVRSTGKPAWQPIGIHFAAGRAEITFSDDLDASVAEAGRFKVKAWQLKRSKKYGSPHVDEHPLAVAGVERIGPRTLRLLLPALHVTQGLEIACRLQDAQGADIDRVIHATIHELPKP